MQNGRQIQQTKAPVAEALCCCSPTHPHPLPPPHPTLLIRSSSLAVKNQYRQAVTPNMPYTLHAGQIRRSTSQCTHPKWQQVFGGRREVCGDTGAAAQQSLMLLPEHPSAKAPHLESSANMGLHRKVSSVPNTSTRTCTQC
jgi:hypothetical protein